MENSTRTLEKRANHIVYPLAYNHFWLIYLNKFISVCFDGILTSQFHQFDFIPIKNCLILMDRYVFFTLFLFERMSYQRCNGNTINFKREREWEKSQRFILLTARTIGLFYTFYYDTNKKNHQSIQFEIKPFEWSTEQKKLT